MCNNFEKLFINTLEDYLLDLKVNYKRIKELRTPPHIFSHDRNEDLKEIKKMIKCLDSVIKYVA
jgi:hypothetical protein